MRVLWRKSWVWALLLLPSLCVFLRLPLLLHPNSYLRAPQVQLQQAWAAPATLCHGCCVYDEHVGQPQPAGGMLYLDGDSSYLLGPAGQDFTPQVIHEHSYDDCFPGPSGGFYLTSLRGLERYAETGKMLWGLPLGVAPGPAYTDSGLRVVLDSSGKPCVFGVDKRWLVSPEDKVLNYSRHADNYDEYIMDSLALNGRSYLLQAKGNSLTLQELSGARCWSRDCKSLSYDDARLLADGSTLMETEEGLYRFDLAGRQLWFKAHVNGYFSVCNAALLVGGGTAIWWDEKLCFWNADGSEALTPLWLGAEDNGPFTLRQRFIEGLDGNIYISLKPSTLLAVSPTGELLWRAKTDGQPLELCGAAADGSVYARRLGKVISSGVKRATVMECDFVCLRR